jgi:radical SAM protein with 4Fe4S-binding SPASM domain
MAFDGLPLLIGWELTLACNLRCRHCGSAAGLPRRDELSLAEALSVCDQLPDLLVQEVDFTGGEPLVRADWPRIAGRLARLGIRMQIITNGLCLSPDVVAEIVDSGIGSVGFSLDGLEPTHDQIRGYPGLFRRVLTGMEQAQRAGLRVVVLTTANKRNLPELPALLELLRSMNIPLWQLQPLFPLGRAEGSAELALTPEEYMEIGAFLKSYSCSRRAGELSLELADSLGYGTEYDIRDVLWCGCPAGRMTCGITSDGKIKGCLSMPDRLTQGDLRQNDLWDIWFRPDAFAYNRRFSQEDLGPACLGCDRAEFCMGGCSSMSVGATGAFHGDPYCFYGITHRENWKGAAEGSRLRD